MDFHHNTHYQIVTGDFDVSAVEVVFNVTAGVGTKQHTYNAVIADDDEDENVEGFILYFEFQESVLNPDDYSRLSQTTAVTLVRIIDNDGCKSI